MFFETRVENLKPKEEKKKISFQLLFFWSIDVGEVVFVAMI